MTYATIHSLATHRRSKKLLGVANLHRKVRSELRRERLGREREKREARNGLLTNSFGRRSQRVD